MHSCNSLIFVFWSTSGGLRDWHNGSNNQSAASAVSAVQSATSLQGFHNHVMYSVLRVCVFTLNMWNTSSVFVFRRLLSGSRNQVTYSQFNEAKVTHASLKPSLILTQCSRNSLTLQGLKCWLKYSLMRRQVVLHYNSRGLLETQHCTEMSKCPMNVTDIIINSYVGHTLSPCLKGTYSFSCR